MKPLNKGCIGMREAVLCLEAANVTYLWRTPLGPTQSSIIERVSSGQGFIIHYVGYIWDSVSFPYRECVL